jgi:hypothetical protein
MRPILARPVKKPTEKYFTLHPHQQKPKPLMLQIVRGSAALTYILAFRQEDTAIQFARIFEAHYRQSGEWPHTYVDEEHPLTINGGDAYNPHAPLEMMDVVAWKDKDLYTYTAEQLVNIMVMEKGMNNYTTLVFDYPDDWVRSVLTKRMTLDS